MSDEDMVQEMRKAADDPNIKKDMRFLLELAADRLELLSDI